MLYPPSFADEDQDGPAKSRSNSYEPFRMLDTRIEEGLRSMAEDEQRRMAETDAQGINGTFTSFSDPYLQADQTDPPAIVSALTKALCRMSSHIQTLMIDINRLSPPSTHAASLTASDSSMAQAAQDRIEPRILIINATPGSQGSAADGNEDGNGTDSSGGGRMRGGYVGLMNCVFAAQKAVCSLSHSSSLVSALVIELMG
jgi:transcription initiation factor TFIIH subunit 3